MSRPKPKVIMEKIDKNYEKYEVVEINDIYAVFYEGKMINLRTNNIASPNNSLKYKKTIFTEYNKAEKMAKNLNEIFNTDKFEVKNLNDYC